MPNNKTLIYSLLAAFVAIVGVIFIWNNYQIQIQDRTDKPIEIPKPGSKQCGIESCHGLEITCGPNVPEVCTEIYMAGDNCRQFVNCETIDGQCQQSASPKFDNCKSCVQKCEQNFKNDPMQLFECESRCTEI